MKIRTIVALIIALAAGLSAAYASYRLTNHRVPNHDDQSDPGLTP